MAQTSTNYGFYRPEATDNIIAVSIPGLNSAIQGVDTKIKELDDQNVKKTLTSAKGDMIYASANNTPARLAKGTEGQILSQGASDTPAWIMSPVLTGSALPDAGVSYRGKVFTVLGDTDVADTSHICLKLADNSYEWQEITFAI